MIASIGDTFVLTDDREYIIVGKTEYENTIYYLLVNEDANGDVRFCFKDKKSNDLIVSDDHELNQKLLPLFSNSMQKFISDNK